MRKRRTIEQMDFVRETSICHICPECDGPMMRDGVCWHCGNENEPIDNCFMAYEIVSKEYALTIERQKAETEHFAFEV